MKEFSLKKSLAMLVVLFALGACDLLESWADKVGGRTVGSLGHFSEDAEVFTSYSSGEVGKTLYFKLGDFTPDNATYKVTDDNKTLSIYFWIDGDTIHYDDTGLK